MRIPKHHTIERYDSRVLRVEQMGLSEESPVILKDCRVDGVVGDVWAKRLEDGDFLFLFGTVNAEFMAGRPVPTALQKTLDDRLPFPINEGTRVRRREDSSQVARKAQKAGGLGRNSLWCMQEHGCVSSRKSSKNKN